MRKLIFLIGISLISLIYIIGFVCASLTINDVSPKKTAVTLATEFEVSVNGDGVSKYIWNFGDNTSLETTTTNKVTHIYEDIGTYNFKITIEDSSEGNSSKYFTINIISSKEFAQEKIEKKESEIENLVSEIDALGEFEKELIKESLGVDNIEERIKEARRDYTSATSNDAYNKISKELTEIEIPSNLAVSKEATGITFFPQTKVINVGVVKSIIGGDYEVSEEEAYAERIKTWQYAKLDVEMDFKEISGVYYSGEERLARIFSIDIDAKEGLENTPYIFLKNLEGLSFQGINPEENSEGYYVIEMKGNSMVLGFSTTESFAFSDLPLFISPNLDYLEISELPTKRGENFDWKWFWIIIILVLLISLMLYIFLQEWYKRKYEGYLFKQRNDLYNLIVYVKKAKDKGINEGTIRKKLKEQKWNNEQINYVLKKYSGKRTGMVEIPVSKFIDKIKELYDNIFHKEKPKQENYFIGRRTPTRKI